LYLQKITSHRDCIYRR